MDPDEEEHNHAPAQNLAPDSVLDISIGEGHKGYERPDQDHLENKVIILIQAYIAFINQKLSCQICMLILVLLNLKCVSNMVFV